MPNSGAKPEWQQLYEAAILLIKIEKLGWPKINLDRQ
jgi:hypothetical protein